MSIFYQDQLMSDYPPDCIVHYITQNSYRQKFDANFYDVLVRRHVHLVSTLNSEICNMDRSTTENDSNDSAGIMSFAKRSEIQLASTYERHFLNKGLLNEDNDWLHDQHETLKEHIIKHLKTKATSLYGDSSVNFIFNIGGGNSLHQMVLSEIFYNQGLGNQNSYYAVYPDFHSNIIFYSQNYNGGYPEIGSHHYNYIANISLRDYISLEGRHLKPDKSEELNKKCIYPNNKEHSYLDSEEYYQNMWKDIWDDTVKISQQHFEFDFSTDSSMKRISELLKIRYSNLESRVRMIKVLSNNISCLENNYKNYSFKKVFQQIKTDIKEMISPTSRAKKSKGIRMESVLIYQLKKYLKEKTLNNIQSIHHNIDITTKSNLTKEYDIVILNDKMKIDVYDVKMRPQESKDDESTKFKLMERSSEYHKVSYVVPVNTKLSREQQGHYYRRIGLRNSMESRTIFFYEWNNWNTNNEAFWSKSEQMVYVKPENSPPDYEEDTKIGKLINFFSIFN